MAFTVKNFPDPRDPARPLATAYAYLACVLLDQRTEAGAGLAVWSVHPSEDAWQGAPVGRVEAALGQRFGDASFPTLAELLDDPEFRAAYEVIAAKLYGHAGAVVPAFAGADPA